MYRISLNSIKASDHDKEYIQRTDTIILPESQSKKVIGKTIGRKSEKPLYFIVKAIKGGKNPRQVCCRVADFSSPNYSCTVLPDWMFDFLGLSERELVSVSEIIMENGKELTLKLHRQELLDKLRDLDLDISKILSPELSAYGCLTRGSTIEVKILGDDWKIDVVDIKDHLGKSKIAISTINTDLDLILLPALDFVERVPVANDEYMFRPTEVVPEKTPEIPAEKTPEKMPEEVSKKTPERPAEKTPEKVSKKTPEKVSEEVAEEVAEKMPERPAGQLTMEEIRQKRLQAFERK